MKISYHDLKNILFETFHVITWYWSIFMFLVQQQQLPSYYYYIHGCHKKRQKLTEIYNNTIIQYIFKTFGVPKY